MNIKLRALLIIGMLINNMMCIKPKDFEDVVARKVGESKAKFMLKRIAKGVAIGVFCVGAACALFIVGRFIKTNPQVFINIGKKVISKLFR